MAIVLAVFAVVFVILGFGGFAFGGIPTIVFWILAALCIFGGWKLRSGRQRRREDRAMGPRP
jgi:peptidoglycan/LPS O-acetylase OafA/YrhL